ncbi:MAG: hypothetical protein ACR2GW_06675 [Pyrinomonadaceae bacterium]
MAEKKSKYDTDPLDPEFVRRTEEMMNAATRDIARTPNEPARSTEQAEAPTRLMDDTLKRSYPSVFVPPAYQAPSQPPQMQPLAQPPAAQPPQAAPPPHTRFDSASRRVAGLNIPEKFATVLPYAPFYVGIVVAFIELLIVPRREGRVRFHAAQGLALQLALLAISIFFDIVGIFGNVGFGRLLIGLTGFIFLIYSMFRVWRGEDHHLSPLDDATRWLNQHIDPRKK